MKNARRVGGALIQFIAYPASVIAFAGVFFGAALILNYPAGLLSLGLFAAFVTATLLSWLTAKLLKLRRAWRYAGLQAAGTLLVLAGVISVFVLRPLIPKSEQYVRSIPDEVVYWDLPTGSRIAVRKVGAQEPSEKDPIIFLHGGPGSYSVGLEQTVTPISKLSLDGHDVYFYDQIGSGLSERLSDITQYSLERHIADLEAVYEKIGSQKVILIGSSFGATLSANYMARRPSHVSHAVFSGAGPIYKPDWLESGDGSLDDAMSPSQKVDFDRAVMRPRMLVALILADINPKAAGRFLPSQEAGSFYDMIANDHYMPFTVCDIATVTTKTEGLGFWSNQVTGNTLETLVYDPKPSLRTNYTPVLIVRGECDYKSQTVANQYAEVFPNSTMLSFEDAGHMFYWEKPDEFVTSIREFLESN